MRRLLDASIAGIGLLIALPFFILFAFAIKLEDGGPIFYFQQRIGKNFHEFQIMKFRTMVQGAEKDGFLTLSNDSRVTRVGSFLRRYKFDELPQLLNIMVGHMRFVGPRPEVNKYVSLFRSEYAQLLRERPGISDPASIAFRQEETTLSGENAEEKYLTTVLPQKLKLSLAYQEKRGLLSDAKIVLLTVFGMKGKYCSDVRVRQGMFHSRR